MNTRRPRPAAERFAEKCSPNPETGCIQWVGAINGDGYGNFMSGRSEGPTRRTHQAHRWAYEQARGPVPVGLVLDHLCRNRACVNPAHMEPVTFTENLRRGANAKVTPQIASEIRSRRSAGETVASIARSFGLSVALVSPISRGLKWAP